MLASLRAKMDPPTSIPVSIVSVATRFMAHSFCDVLLCGPRHRFPVPHSLSSHQEVRCKSHGSGIRVQIPEVTRCSQPLSDLSLLKRKARFLTLCAPILGAADTRDEAGLSSFRCATIVDGPRARGNWCRYQRAWRCSIVEHFAPHRARSMMK